jgi:hypothetical protein
MNFDQHASWLSLYLLDGVYVRFAACKRGMYFFVDDGDDIIKTRGLQLSLGKSVSVGPLPFFRK